MRETPPVAISNPAWTLDALYVHMGVVIESLEKQITARYEERDRLYDEKDRRYDERDRRYAERYEAQQFAVRDALAAQEKAVAAALTAADRAVAKAENASEKRFECVSADTPILCSDLIWRPAGDLLVGDELIACDESGDGMSRRGRRFRRSLVTANSLTRDALLIVTTPVGSVRCNFQHPWLARHACSKPETWR